MNMVQLGPCEDADFMAFWQPPKGIHVFDNSLDVLDTEPGHGRPMAQTVADD